MMERHTARVRLIDWIVMAAAALVFIAFSGVRMMADQLRQ